MRTTRWILLGVAALGLLAMMGCAAYPPGMPEDTQRESTSISAGDTDPQNTASGAGSVEKPTDKVVAPDSGVTEVGMGAPGTESRDQYGR